MYAATSAGEAVQIVQIKMGGYSHNNTGFPVSLPRSQDLRSERSVGVEDTVAQKGSRRLVFAYG